jgi:Glycosyl hydrolases family 16
MLSSRIVRFAAPAAVVAVLVPLTGSVPTASASQSHPTNAAKVFRWGNASVKDEFHGRLAKRWKVNKAGHVRNQNGMLTLDSTRRSGTVTATLTGSPRRYGRWEARVRGRQYGASGTAFHAVWELVPTSGVHCGGRGIVLSDYALNGRRARMHVRNLPQHDFTVSKPMALRGNQFHTYAIEVTRSHVSWFVDTQVIRTERRPQARSGAAYNVRFRLQASSGKAMRQGRMQMDWVRYYSLERKNAKSIKAPQLHHTTNTHAC